MALVAFHWQSYLLLFIYFLVQFEIFPIVPERKEVDNYDMTMGDV